MRAISAATMKITSTFPAALASTYRARIAIGRITSCTHRGMTARGGAAGASALRADPLAPAPSAPASTPVGRALLRRRLRRHGGAQLDLLLGGGRCLRGVLVDAAHLPPAIARVWLSPRRPPRCPARQPPAAKTGARARARCGSCSSETSSAGIGRNTLLDCLPLLRERHDPTFVVVNGENAAGGLGITPRNADQMFAAGVDAITLGNHTYHRREIYPYLETHERIVRPANFLRSQPGRGSSVVEHDGVRLGVVNLSGNLYLRAGRSMFTEVEAALSGLGQVDHVLVDVHAEATSEKVALGWHLDGRVTAVVGTHTHVPTADARVLPGGTAYITDVGMTGPRGGVIGVKREQAIESLLTQMPVRFETSEEDPWLMGVLISCSRPLRADSIEQVMMPRPAQAVQGR